MIRSGEELVGMGDAQDQCTVYGTLKCYDQAQRRTSQYGRCAESAYSVWHTDMMLNKVCNSAGALLTHQHKDMPGIQDISYFYIGRINSLMRLIMFNF